MLEQRQMRLDASSIPLEDIYMAMGYRGAQPEVQIRKWISEVYSDIVPICAPRYMYQILEVDKLSGRCLQIGGIDFHVGGIIGSYLPGMTHACLFVTTAGQEYDAYLNSLKKADNIIKEYIADAIGSAVAEFCVNTLSKELDLACGSLQHSLPYSPGYCGWDIREQQKLFSLFPPHPCGITLSDSSLMSPVKSVSGFFGLGKELHPQPYRCEICMNKHCYKREERTV